MKISKTFVRNRKKNHEIKEQFKKIVYNQKIKKIKKSRIDFFLSDLPLVRVVYSLARALVQSIQKSKEFYLMGFGDHISTYIDYITLLKNFQGRKDCGRDIGRENCSVDL